MKTLIWKELRENFKLAVLGFAAFTLLVLATWRSYDEIIENVLRGSQPGDFFNHLQPLSSSEFTGEAGIFCAVFGLLLGWSQIFHERHRDLWAYLVHRPICRTDVFLGKLAAGLGIYCVAAGLPLGVFILWAAIPGHVAAPFEWQLLHPFVAHFLAGMAYYLAGMLTGLRQARWYGSRGLGIGAALLASALITGAPETWEFLLAIVLALGVLGTAVWGAFHSHGNYHGQPAVGKVGLSLSFAAGGLVLVFLAAALLANLVPGLSSSIAWSYYGMTKDGQVYKQISGGRGEVEFRTLSGNPVKDANTGKILDTAEIQKRAAPRASVLVEAGQGSSKSRNRNGFSFLRASSGTLWFTWQKYGRIIGYDMATRKPIGSIGPEGFAPDLRGNGGTFHPHTYENPWTPAEIFNTDTQAYQVDAQERKVTSLFTTGSEDPIVATAEVKATNGGGLDYGLVLTKQSAVLVTSKGVVAFRVPFQDLQTFDTTVEITVLEPPGKFALWVTPAYSVPVKQRAAIPTKVLRVSADGGITDRTEIPSLVPASVGGGLGEKLMGVSMPLAFEAVVLWLMPLPQVDFFPAVWLPLGLAAAFFLWVPLTWWLGRRANLPRRALLAWSIFQVAFGLPGFLAFLCAQEWPARETCPNCKKPRVVDHEQCEHCGANFAPPEMIGTEIFETLGAKI